MENRTSSRISGYADTLETLPTSGVYEEGIASPARHGFLLNAATAAMVLPVLLAGGSITSSVNYVPPSGRNHYVTSSVMSPFRRRRRGRSVSLQEARLVALQVFAAAEEGLKKDREEEARIMLKFWDDSE